MTVHKIYLKINPNTEKDSKTIILEKVSGDINELPQKDIFEKPAKENRFVIFLKKLFTQKIDKQETIDTIKFD